MICIERQYLQTNYSNSKYTVYYNKISSHDLKLFMRTLSYLKVETVCSNEAFKKKLLMKRKTFIKTNIFCSPLNIKLNQHQSENHCKIKIRKKNMLQFPSNNKKEQNLQPILRRHKHFFYKNSPTKYTFYPSHNLQRFTTHAPDFIFSFFLSDQRKKEWKQLGSATAWQTMFWANWNGEIERLYVLKWL